MNIQPIDRAGDCKTGSLEDITVKEIAAILGFEANVPDDPDKVSHSWGFTVDGIRCGVWSYKGSENEGYFSTWGPHEVLKNVFGTNYNPN